MSTQVIAIPYRAIATALTLRTVFGLPCGQTEGFIGSLSVSTGARERTDLAHARFPQEACRRGPRQGFFEIQEYQSVREHLPPELQDVVDCGYSTGWRKREILDLEWHEVDLEPRTVKLSASRSKNKEPRTIVMTAHLREVFERRMKRRVLSCTYVFHRNGRQINHFDIAWKSATNAAQCEGRRFHDFRNTAARNLNRSGVPQSVAHKLLGHRTSSVFDRDNVTDEQDIREAADKLEAYLRDQGEKVRVRKRRAT